MRGDLVRAALLGATLALLARPAGATAIDGVLEAAYGPALSTQICQAYLKNNLGQAMISDGSELDEAYAVVQGGTLDVFLAGNLADSFCPSGPVPCGQALMLFFDTGAGGQSPLFANPATTGTDDLWQLAGLTFDAGFAPDYSLEIRAIGPGDPGNFWVEFASLPTGAAATVTYVGQGVAGGANTLAGGTNPYGILAAIDESNVAGVTAGCGAASGAGVTTGIELAIPLAALGNPADCVRICALVYDPRYDVVGNQVLGPLPPGTCGLGAPGGVNFASIAGDQFFSICAGATPAGRPTWGRLKSAYR